MKKCFIVCPIGELDTTTRKRSDNLLEYVLKPVCDERGFQAIRIDEVHTADSITQNIIEHLTSSDLVIADLTEHNPNVFFELGYRTAIKKPVIHIRAKSERIPFDIADIQTFEYDLTDLGAVDQFKARITKTIQSFNYDALNSSEQPSQAPDIFNSTIVFNSTILQEIYKLQDMVAQLSIQPPSSDTAAASVLADKLRESSSKSPESVAMEVLLSKVLDDPKKLLELAALAEQFPSKD